MPKTRAEEKTLTRRFETFDCVLEYVPRKKVVVIRYVRTGRTFFTSCVRMATRQIFTRMAGTLTEREAASLVVMGITTL